MKTIELKCETCGKKFIRILSEYKIKHRGHIKPCVVEPEEYNGI